jgi:type II secretory ATPase GspE/PulE/Tfp pilus assembly ATPase PilB-like protein
VNQTTRYLEQSGGNPDISTLVGCLVLDAVDSGASDIHIEPWESSIAVRIRLNGVLSELAHLPLDFMERISGRLKVMADLISYETDLPQEGRAPADPSLGGVELRISVFPTVRGEKIVIRIFDPRNRSFKLDDLGFDSHSMELFVKLLARPSGLLLLTGPTGSGKTTAMYSALYHLTEKNGPGISISTVEDPVEFNLPMISQSQVKRAKEYTYPIALRSLMRQDPEVIMIGEIRDGETAAIAVQAGLTGHLVISTIHSGSTAGVFARLINMEIEPFLIASSLVGVMGLRLIRTNCPHCAEPYQPEAALLHSLPKEVVDIAQFRKGVGCAVCHNTGFGKRTSLTEMLVLDEVLRDAILQKMPTRKLQEIAIKEGMRTLFQSGMERVIHGHTTVEEVLRMVAMDQF